MPATYALIHEENNAFGISFPDFPGAVTAGDSAEDAIRRGGALLSFHVAGMIEDGEALPRQRSYAELKADPVFHEDAEGAVLAVVQFDVPGKAVRVNLSLEETLLQAIDRNAEASGQSRSGWLAEAARVRLMQTGTVRS